MKSVAAANGMAGQESPALILNGFLAGEGQNTSISVQKALTRWYKVLKGGNSAFLPQNLFPVISGEKLISSLKNDLNLAPELLMDELVNDLSTADKGQYLRLVQATLVNLSDLLKNRGDELSDLCLDVEQVLEFMQDFFARHFDFEYRATSYCLEELKNSFHLKIEYWHLRTQSSLLTEVLDNCLNEKTHSPENQLSFRKVAYLKQLFTQLELSVSVLSETAVKEILIYNNFNSSLFIEYEAEEFKKQLNTEATADENIALLMQIQKQVAGMKIKKEVCFEISQPSATKQLSDWIKNEIQILELKNQTAGDKEFKIDAESKIQTSLSVAKLAVLIRLLVVDKVIINKSVAPMLRTVAKLFSTLQKDEISFGSLETKYHAPDKNTLSIVKEMLQKWVALTGKL